MDIRHTIYVTGKDGHEGVITAPEALLTVIEAALYKAGARFETRIETWDFGYYKDGGRYEKRHPDVVAKAEG